MPILCRSRARRASPDPAVIVGGGRGARSPLKKYGILRSMSGKGNCYDNAAESFFSSLKNEIIHHRGNHTRDEARAEIFQYIGMFYNRKRLHQSLNYQTPMQLQARWSVA